MAVTILAVLCTLLTVALVLLLARFKQVSERLAVHLKMWGSVMLYFSQASDRVRQVAAKEQAIAYASQEAAEICGIASDISELMIVVAQQVGQDGGQIIAEPVHPEEGE